MNIAHLTNKIDSHPLCIPSLSGVAKLCSDHLHFKEFPLLCFQTPPFKQGLVSLTVESIMQFKLQMLPAVLLPQIVCPSQLPEEGKLDPYISNICSRTIHLKLPGGVFFLGEAQNPASQCTKALQWISLLPSLLLASDSRILQHGSQGEGDFNPNTRFVFSYEPATLSTRLQKNIPTPKPFEQGIKDILFEKSMEKQMSKWVQSGAAAINDAMINDSKYLGYS